MDTVDEYIPTPERDTDKPFLMPVEDVFTITGRGTVASGRIDRGTIKVGDEVEIIGLKPEVLKSTVTGLEMFRKTLDLGEAGDNVGVLLRGINRDQVERGQVLAKPGSIQLHSKFKGEVYILTKEEGGRHTPFFSNYRPQFYFHTTDVTGVIELPDGVEMVMPGDNVTFETDLISLLPSKRVPSSLFVKVAVLSAPVLFPKSWTKHPVNLSTSLVGGAFFCANNSCGWFAGQKSPQARQLLL